MWDPLGLSRPVMGLLYLMYMSVSQQHYSVVLMQVFIPWGHVLGILNRHQDNSNMLFLNTLLA